MVAKTGSHQLFSFQLLSFSPLLQSTSNPLSYRVCKMSNPGDDKTTRTAGYSRTAYLKRKAIKEASLVNVQEVHISKSSGELVSSSLPYLVRFVKDLKKMGDLKTWENRLKSQLALRVVQVSEWIIKEEEFDRSHSWMKLMSIRHTEKLTPSSEISRSWKIQFRDAYLNEWVSMFLVKKSTIEDARYGLFAERAFAKGDVLGVFYGRVTEKSAYKPTSKYAITVAWPPNAKDHTSFFVDPKDGPTTTRREIFPAYFGIHMANDPNYKKRTGEVHLDLYNFIIDASLVAIATKDIAVGDELFLQYRGATF
jgi:hypothetical protein